MMREPISGESLHREFHAKVTAYVRGKVGNFHDAEELVSTVFFKAVQKLDTFDETKASLSTWIYTITRNAVTDYYRTRRATVSLEDYMLGEEPAQDVNDGALEHLADALLTLGPRDRDLIILHYFKGYTLKDTAEMLGMSYVNAKVVHKKALDKLRTYYEAG